MADQIAEVNDINLVGVTHAFAVQTLRNTEEVKLLDEIIH